MGEIVSFVTTWLRDQLETLYLKMSAGERHQQLENLKKKWLQKKEKIDIISIYDK